MRPWGVTTSRKRTGPPLPPQEPLRCPGSLLPERHHVPGERVACAVCGRAVEVVPPPEDHAHDPWPGSQVPRLARHYHPR